MTHKLTVRFGGAADATVHDYSDQVRLWDTDRTRAIFGGMRFDNGNASTGQCVLLDVDSAIPLGDANNLQVYGKNEVIWSESSPGYDAWLSVGRVSLKNWQRPNNGMAAGVTREGVINWEDANVELHGLTLTASQSRPSESAMARMQWVIETFCQGSPRPSTDITFDTEANGHLVGDGTGFDNVMEAFTYKAGTPVSDIVLECNARAGKIWGVVIHEDADEAGDHKCFQWLGESNLTTNKSDLSITDVTADIDYETTFYPVWRNGVASTEDPADFVSGVVLQYGNGDDDAVVVTDSDLADQFDYWVEPFTFDRARTETWATARAENIVDGQGKEFVTVQPSLLIPNRLHHKLRAGMCIDIRADAAFGGEDQGVTQTKRISNIEWEPAGTNADGDPCMWANLQLEVPLRILTLPDPNEEIGPQPATCDAAPSVLRTWKPASLAQQGGMTVEGNANTALLAFFIHNAAAADPSASYDTDTVDLTTGTYNFTKYGELVNTGGSTTDLQITVLTLLNPPASNGALGGVTVVDGGDHFSWGLLLLQDINADDLIRTADSFLGTTDSATSCSNTISSQSNELILSILGYTTQQSGADAADPGASQTLLMAWDGSGVSAGQDQFIGGISSQTATGTSTVDSWTQSDGLGGALTQWDLAIAACPAAITIGGPGEGTTGDDGTYVPGGTVVEHGDLSGKGGTMHDATQIEIADAGGYYTSDDVEGALQEIGAAGAGPPALDDLTDVDTTGVADTNVLAYDSGSSLWVPAAAGGGSSLTVEEVDGSPTDSAVSKIIFPNGTLSITSHEATYTPAGGGGGSLTQTYLGYNTIGASWEAITANRQYMRSFTLASTAWVDSIDIYIKGNGSNVFGILWGILTDSSGTPLNLISAGSSGMSTTSTYLNTTGRWFQLRVGGYLAAATYWATFLATSGAMSIAYDGSGSDKYIGQGGTWLSDGSQGTITTDTNKRSIRISTFA